METKVALVEGLKLIYFLKKGQYSFSLTNDEYLTHYWPICNNDMLDYIDAADMTQGSSISFVSDRFGNSNSSLALNDGWTQIPSDVYFDTPEFTISAWVYPIKIGKYARLIDFGNAYQIDNIILRLDSGSDNKPKFFIFPGFRSPSDSVSFKKSLALNLWHHLSVTFDGNRLRSYLDGTLEDDTKYTYTMPQSLVRANNYFGKSIKAGVTFLQLYLDDVRFYSKSLNQNEIMDLKNSNPSKVFI